MFSRGFIYRLCGLTAAYVLLSGAAMACAICFSGKVTSPGQRIDGADIVALAQMTAPGPYRITDTLKGDLAAGSLIDDVVVAREAAAKPDDTVLLVRNKPSQQWSSLGPIGEDQSTWLRRFAAGGASARGARARPAWPPTRLSASTMTDAQWAERLALIAPRLESPDRLSAAIAYGELARAPYDLLLTLRGARSAQEIAEWVAQPGLADRQPGYILLLGIVGGAPERTMIDGRLAALAVAHDATNLAAVIAADLELSGPSRVRWVEETYLADKGRSLPEIEAALLALGVLGTADQTIPRASIVSAYRRFIRARPQMAAFVAQDLSDWKAVEAAGDMEAAIRSGAIKDPGSQFAVLSYLKGLPAAPRPSPTGGDLPL